MRHRSILSVFLLFLNPSLLFSSQKAYANFNFDNLKTCLEMTEVHFIQSSSNHLKRDVHLITQLNSKDDPSYVYNYNAVIFRETDNDVTEVHIIQDMSKRRSLLSRFIGQSIKSPDNVSETLLFKNSDLRKSPNCSASRSQNIIKIGGSCKDLAKRRDCVTSRIGLNLAFDQNSDQSFICPVEIHKNHKDVLTSAKRTPLEQSKIHNVIKRALTAHLSYLHQALKLKDVEFESEIFAQALSPNGSCYQIVDQNDTSISQLAEQVLCQAKPSLMSCQSEKGLSENLTDPSMESPVKF